MENNGLRIVRLTAENVKRLKAVEISPDGTVQVITGRNAQGKTSVLDAIWLALGGGSASRGTTRPIRDGEEQARVELDLGDLVVTRTWKGDKTALTVTSVEGAKFSSPQSILDALVGKLSFDPLEFTRLSAKEQTNALLELVDLDVDLDKLAQKRQELYEQRTETGRQGKAIGTVEVDPDLPDEETSASDLITQIQDGDYRNGQRDSLREEYANLGHKIEQLQQELEEARKRSTVINDWLKTPEAEPVNTETLRAQLATVEETNAAIRANNAAQERKAEQDRLRADYENLTEQIDKLDEKRNDALFSAKFPVEGLGFDDDGVTYQGVPFSQASSAEQIRVSLAMAMALNPRLRVIRILDGSLLDDENLKLITEMAASNDYQVWIERVSDPSETAVVIEDGAVA